MSRGHLPTSQVFVRFLGEAAGSGASGALLGLPPGKATEEQIATALRRQIARVDAHPRAFTAEAEGVRQALRDAAVSLMKTGGTVELPWRGPTATGGSADESAGAGAVRRARVESVDWESYSPKRKLDPAVLVGGLVFIVVFVVVGLSVIMGTRTPPVTTAPAPPPAAPVAATPPTPAPASGTPEAPIFAPSAAPLAPTDPTLALRQLRGAAARIKGGDGAGTQEFAAALSWLGDNWVRLDIGQRRAADDAIIEYLYAAGARAQAWEGVLGALGVATGPLVADAPAAPGEIWPAAFGAGVLQRLSREREFPARFANDLARLHIAALGQDRPRQSVTFEAGATAALRRLIPRILAKQAAADQAAPLLVDQQRDTQRMVDALARWTEAIAALGLDPRVQENLIADAIEGLMLRGEPEADEGVFAGVAQLTLALKWRKEGAARARLLAWFGDARFTASDLSVLTAALVTRSGAEGVDATMALSAGASPMDRQALAERYVQAWGVGAAAAGVDAGDWFEFARTRLDDSAVSGAVPEDLAAAAVLARVNQSARLLWAGDRSAAGASLAKAQGLVNNSITLQRASVRGITVFGGGGSGGAADARAGSGEWAQSYLALGRHISQRLAKLAELEGAEPPVGVDAAVLADEACFGSPPDVRIRAQQVVIRFGQSPAVVNAVLSALPRTPPNESVSRMIQVLTGDTLPRSSHPDWPLRARRALVGTLVDALATDAEQATVDSGAQQIAEAYLDAIAGVDPAAPPDASAPAGAADDRAQRAVSALWDGLIDLARAQSPNPGAHASLETIEARRRARRSLASGPVQRWAAEQAAVCDLLAYVTAAERPATKARVRAVMDDLAIRRRSADSIARQIRSTELAMTRLWVMRLNADDGGAS